jgi:hypothetical protein
MKVDNLACEYGYANHYMKGYVCASILIRAFQLIAEQLGSVLHVGHIQRRSSWKSSTAENLSRKAKACFLEEQMAEKAR